MPNGRCPRPWEIENAKKVFLKSSKMTEAEQKGHIDQSIKKIKEFVKFVRDYETWKEDASKPQAPLATVVAGFERSPSPSSQSLPVILGQQDALEVLQHTQTGQDVAALSASSPPSAPAPET